MFKYFINRANYIFDRRALLKISQKKSHHQHTEKPGSSSFLPSCVMWPRIRQLLFQSFKTHWDTCSSSLVGNRGKLMWPGQVCGIKSLPGSALNSEQELVSCLLALHLVGITLPPLLPVPCLGKRKIKIAQDSLAAFPKFLIHDLPFVILPKVLLKILSKAFDKYQGIAFANITVTSGQRALSSLSQAQGLSEERACRCYRRILWTVFCWGLGPFLESLLLCAHFIRWNLWLNSSHRYLSVLFGYAIV